MPDMKQHTCPYEGWHVVRTTDAGRSNRSVLQCGDWGWLCDRCQQDRANRRARAIVRAILQTCSHHEWTQDDIENCVISILAGEELDA